jgi:cell division transport system permease protein
MKVPSASARAAMSDELGLRRALSGWMLPLLVAAMTLLAALSMAGWIAANGLAHQWSQGAGAVMTVQVPRPDEPAVKTEGTRIAATVALLSAAPGVVSVHVLTEAELTDLLRPWLGDRSGAAALPLPAVIAVKVQGTSLDVPKIGRTLDGVAPGTVVEDHGIWIRRLTVLASGLRACAMLALVLVSIVAIAVIGVATRAGLAARRDAIEIVHGLGAADGFIAGRFARRTGVLAFGGGMLGGLLSVPTLVTLSAFAVPFMENGKPPVSAEDWLATLPVPLWGCLAALPLLAGAIGFVTADTTVRRWLRQLP